MALAEKDKNGIQVSVMVTFYNQKQYIEDCLAAIVSQETDFGFEILCGDDGSSDETYEELLRWKERYPELISVYRMDRDAAVKYEAVFRASKNRLNLLRHAKGKYVTFLDGDDYYSSNLKLQKQFEMLEKYPDIGCCCHPMTRIWENGEEPDSLVGDFSDKPFIMSSKAYWGCLYVPAEAFLFRNIYQGKVEQIDERLFDDTLIVANFLKAGRSVGFLPEPMCVYRCHSDSSWNSMSVFKRLLGWSFSYQESKKTLPNMKFQCFMRCQGAIQNLYALKDEEWVLKESDLAMVTEPVFLDTVCYRRAGRLRKRLYVLKWYLPAHCDKWIDRIKRKYQRSWQFI